jgi:hypothetical protein
MAARKRRIALPKKKEKVTIFVSFSKEDETLAKAVENELNRVFPHTTDVITSIDFKQGENWRDAINEGLDRADILLIIFSNQQKISHSFTGFEVGYFVHSLKFRPTIHEDQKRLIIPFCIGRQIPDTTEYFQGVQIDQEAIFNLVEDLAAFQNKKFLTQSLEDSNPVLKFLERISDVVSSVTGITPDPDAMRANIHESAIRLFRTIYAYLEGRVYLESFPERKVVIRTAIPSSSGIGLPTLPLSDEEFLEGATIELMGRSFELFGIPASNIRQSSWREFISKINPPEGAMAWKEGIKFLVSATLRRDFDNNYQFISTVQHDRAFRMFVARVSPTTADKPRYTSTSSRSAPRNTAIRSRRNC